MDEIAPALVLVNGRVLTLDPRRPVASALAVADGRIAAVGGREVARRRDRRTRVIDLHGATVVPGLVDAHAHLDREGLKALHPSLARCRSIADIQRLIGARAARQKPGTWIVTMPVGAPPFYQGVPECLAEGRWPTREDLDAAAPDHPVYIRGIWGYWNRPPVYSVANSLALEQAGITAATVPPRGIEIVKDASGRPSGVLVEHNVIQVMEFTLMRAAPRFTAEDRRRALVASQRAYAARGVTAVYEGHGIAPEVLTAYRESHARGELRLRCSLAVSPTWAAAEAAGAIPALAAWAGGRGLGDDRLRVGGICLHYGGDPEIARILHEGQPYTAWAGFVESANDPAAYAMQAELAARHRLRVNTLVTRCLPEVLDAWEAVAARYPIRDLRWVLVHLNAATPAQLARIRRLGVVATTNPISYLYRSAGEEAAKLGGDADQLLPHRSLIRHRIPYGIATDNKPADPWAAFAAVVARRDMRTGAVVGERERLSRRQALLALTQGGAWITFAERERGRLAPGWAADLAVLEHDPLSAPLESLVGQTARLTVVGGEIVHRA
ncbi:MAG TPA: amidohydrolase family protein [Methylomirabilota bacterium]|nr:amidohydrolase family protein [Methylomirabilota bacterium]